MIFQGKRGGFQFNERRFLAYGFLYSLISDEISIEYFCQPRFSALCLKYPDRINTSLALFLEVSFLFQLDFATKIEFP